MVKRSPAGRADLAKKKNLFSGVCELFITRHVVHPQPDSAHSSGNRSCLCYRVSFGSAVTVQRSWKQQLTKQTKLRLVAVLQLSVTSHDLLFWIFNCPVPGSHFDVHELQYRCDDLRNNFKKRFHIIFQSTIIACGGNPLFVWLDAELGRRP